MLTCNKTRLSILVFIILTTTVTSQSMKDLSYLHNAVKESSEDMGSPNAIFQDWITKLLDLYDVVTVSDDYKRKLRETHEKSGALRSGEGTES